MGTVLCDNVVEVVGLIGIVEFDDVRMTQNSMHFYFVLQHCQIRRLKFAQIDHLYGIGFTFSLGVSSLVNSATEAFSN